MTYQERNAYINPARGGAATIWRHGFAYGFRDALSLVARELGLKHGIRPTRSDAATHWQVAND